jgi:ankyrin repeat protein
LHAAKEGLFDVLKAKIDGGSNPNDVVDRHGLTALQWAAGGGHVAVVRVLSSVGKNKDSRGCADSSCTSVGCLKGACVGCSIMPLGGGHNTEGAVLADNVRRHLPCYNTEGAVLADNV